jgi:hypothetical protein
MVPITTRYALVGRIPPAGITVRALPIDLTTDELATAAQACRALAYQEGERAKKKENPGTRGPVENAAPPVRHARCWRCMTMMTMNSRLAEAGMRFR